MSVPDPQKELERKALETVQAVADKVASGQLTALEFYATVDAVYDTVSGLIDKRLLDSLLQMRGAARPPTVERRIFRHGTRALALVRTHGAGAFLCYDLTEGRVQRKSFEDELNPSARATAAMNVFAGSLLAKGWKEL